MSKTLSFIYSSGVQINAKTRYKDFHISLERSLSKWLTLKLGVRQKQVQKVSFRQDGCSLEERQPLLPTELISIPSGTWPEISASFHKSHLYESMMHIQQPFLWGWPPFPNSHPPNKRALLHHPNSVLLNQGRHSGKLWNGMWPFVLMRDCHLVEKMLKASIMYCESYCES